jgi:ubiquitin-like-conjugating enzyme ATG3
MSKPTKAPREKESLRTWLTQKAILTAEKYAPTSNTSTFHKTGKLTPDEFVLAGDYLTQNFPLWTWESGNKTKTRSHLPEDKQYLLLKGVACQPPQEADVDSCEWVEPTETPTLKSNIEFVKDDDDIPELPPSISKTELSLSDDDDDDVDSLDGFDYDESAIENDPATLTSSTLDEQFVKHRSYDMMITYDTYYSTPRVWFFGYDEDSEPLTGNKWQRDFSKEHLNKTVTFESHPHLVYSCPTIHPCKHDIAMLRMINAAGKDIDVKNYLLIFLKFIQTIVPNMEYDYTGDYSV